MHLAVSPGVVGSIADDQVRNAITGTQTGCVIVLFWTFDRSWLQRRTGIGHVCKAEFKREAVRLVLSSSLSRERIAQGLGIGAPMLTKWVRNKTVIPP